MVSKRFCVINYVGTLDKEIAIATKSLEEAAAQIKAGCSSPTCSWGRRGSSARGREVKRRRLLN